MKIMGVLKMEIKQYLFIFDLRGANVILGMDWLTSLVDIVASFINLAIE